jgi:uncharacterized protein involved in exopolysaccharide biosynthesis
MRADATLKDVDMDARPNAWAQAPALTAFDWVALAWRERRLALKVGAVVFAVGALIALLQTPRYTAQAGVLVRLGQEYVYQPKVGAAGAGAAPKLEEVMNAELRLATSPEVARRVITEIGLARIDPGAGAAQDAAGAERRLQDAVKAYGRSLGAGIAPQTPVIAFSFKHKSPQVAADIVNAHIDAYIAFRREVLVEPGAAALAEQGADFQVRLAAATAALAAFGRTHQVGDLETEMKALEGVLGALETDIFNAQSQRRSVEAQALALRQRVAGQPRTIEMFVERDADRVLAGLQVERAQLAARYAETAPPIVEIDRRIGEVKAALAAGAAPSLTRRGANPVRQDLETKLFAAEAEAQALAARERTLRAQKDAAAARVGVLQGIEPEYRRLVREKAILEDNARSFGGRAAEARAFQELAAQANEAVRPMERAVVPARGASLRAEILAAALALATLLGLTAALWRGVSAGRMPTAQSASRTLGTPVVGVTATETAPPRRTASA